MNASERVGRAVNVFWVLAALVVFVVWWRDPDLLTRDALATRIESWGPWTVGGFIAVSLVRGFLLMPSTPVVLTGGLLFPDAPAMVFGISMVGIVVSATAVYLLPGLGGYDDLLRRRYPGRIARVKRRLAGPQAFWIVVGWSFLPFVPTDVICYVAGLLGMPYRRMIVALLLGEAPLVLGYLSLTQLALDVFG